MKLFEILEKECNKKKINHSEEYKFFNANKSLLSINPLFEKYADVHDIFDVICANIIINGIKNKDLLDKVIEEEYFSNKEKNVEIIKQEIKDRIIDLPYLKVNKVKVYIPFFNLNTNIVYSVNSEMMFREPYINLVSNYDAFLTNPFNTYGADIFNFLSTKLVRISESTTTIAFYHFDFNTIFIINRQGSLDNAIYLFDKNIKKPDYSHIVERIKPLIQAYYDGKLTDFIYLLYKNKFISYKVFTKICKEKKL